MKLILNGEPREFENVPTLAALIEKLGMKSDRVAVERNRAIVPRVEWANRKVSDCYLLEIVLFVGGG